MKRSLALLLLLPSLALAGDFDSHLALRGWWSDSPNYPFRGELVLQVGHLPTGLWVRDLLIWDRGDPASPRLADNVLNNRAMLGFELARVLGLRVSVVGERQDITSVRAAHRIGLEVGF